MEVRSKLDRQIRITDDYWEYITRVKHKEMINQKNATVNAIAHPVEIHRSLKDPSVFLYYGRKDDGLICVVARHLNADGFIITAYPTRKIGGGEVVWKD